MMQSYILMNKYQENCKIIFYLWFLEKQPQYKTITSLIYS